MKNNKNDLMRIESMLNGDRQNSNDVFNRLLLCDIEKLLRDYFDFSNTPSIEITKSGNSISVNISVEVNKLYQFNKLK